MCVCVCVCVCMCVKLGWKMKALHASLHGIITTTLIQIEIENRGKKKRWVIMDWLEPIKTLVQQPRNTVVCIWGEGEIECKIY